MSTAKTLRIVSTSSAATEQIAARLGQALKGGEVIELVSDLGGGKTTFVRGLVSGLGSDDRVASPTFTIGKVYQTPAFEVHHFDFYRLADAGLAAYELADIMGDPHTVTVIEWGDVLAHVLPADRLTIAISRTGDEERVLTCTYTPRMAYLAEALC